MTSLRAGDVVIGVLTGSQKSKSRPAVVVSSAVYHSRRPDIVVGFLTSQVAGSNAPTDYALVDWRAAGLNQPSAFRAYLITTEPTQVTKIGRLSDTDWAQVQARLRLALEI